MKINGEKNKKMKQKYNIKTYPALVLIEDKDFKLFKSERTIENINRFLSE